eukprot:TRINITY_DN886_c2_g1_i2.p1 TRINITY_DN886_c2_g1~~TRINITY_DN886_c2_g1_i2.p1  ORF type:complete len:269 (-),score=62.45 TRINITY_DN886_c2_g1_i2:92-898(-)
MERERGTNERVKSWFSAPSNGGNKSTGGNNSGGNNSRGNNSRGSNQGYRNDGDVKPRNEGNNNNRGFVRNNNNRDSATSQFGVDQKGRIKKSLSKRLFGSDVSSEEEQQDTWQRGKHLDNYNNYGRNNNYNNDGGNNNQNRNYNNSNNNNRNFKNDDKRRNKKPKWEKYVDEKSLKEGIKNGTYWQGEFRINPTRTRICYVTVDETVSDVLKGLDPKLNTAEKKFKQDVLIEGYDKNRAFDGDTVVIKIKAISPGPDIVRIDRLRALS